MHRGLPEPLPGEYGTFAYVKISDGCRSDAAHRAIPGIRGPYHSFPFEEIAEEVRRAVEAGVGEVDLIAQDTGRWGQDFERSGALWPGCSIPSPSGFPKHGSASCICNQKG